MKGWKTTLTAVVAVSFGVATAAFASAAGGHEAAGLPWKDFFLRLMNFAIMVAILIKLLKKPVANFFSSRRENIQRLLTELEEKKKEMEAKAAEYQAKLAALDQETEQILAEYIQEGEAEKQKIIEAAEKEAHYIKEQARFAIQQEIKAAKESLQEEIAELSVNAAEDLLKKSIRPEDQDRLIDEFITKAVEAK
ncbi:F0F1 ATP synthase subunit B [Desulfosoma caldarium]|uniref:ATP synthase subunit b n=1 Tax=Desulfosoma caldarium TaxID=610254 RepID=A0A3N1VQY6_9BACT|nr:F0F1 ATP synthase subunit B [Desulfosoma caldarium]ROR03478.1 F-type H+-transporting ATPase subunit b [Desulfosoma caldarium]